MAKMCKYAALSLCARGLEYVGDGVGVEELHGEHGPEVLVGELGREVVPHVGGDAVVAGALVPVPLVPEPLGLQA